MVEPAKNPGKDQKSSGAIPKVDQTPKQDQSALPEIVGSYARSSLKGKSEGMGVQRKEV